MREKRQAIRSPAAPDPRGDLQIPRDLKGHKQSSCSVGDNEQLFDQYAATAAAEEDVNTSVLRPHSTSRHLMPTLREKCKDVQSLYLSEARKIDPAAYRRHLRPPYQNTEDSHVTGEPDRSRGTTLYTPFKREHFSDMQDIAEAQYQRASLRYMPRDKVAMTNTQLGGRYMDTMHQLVTADDFDAPLEEAIAGVKAPSGRKGRLPAREEAVSRAFDRFDRKYARAGQGITNNLMDGTEYVVSGWYNSDEARHETIMPAKSARRQSANIISHLEQRAKLEAKQDLLMNYGLVGWTGVIVPCDERGKLVANNHPAGQRAHDVLERFLSTDAFMEEERRLSDADAEGDEYDLIWATKLGCLGDVNPYSIKRRAELDPDSEMEGLRILPPLHPGPTTEQHAQQLTEAFWVELQRSMAISTKESAEISSTSHSSAQTAGTDRGSGESSVESYEKGLEGIRDHFWMDVDKIVSTQLTSSKEQTPSPPSVSGMRDQTRSRKRGIEQVDSDAILTSKRPRRSARQKLKAQAKKISDDTT